MNTLRLPSLIRFAFLIAIRRTTADWRLQIAAGFGMILAVALMASAVIYSNALKETALQHTLRNVTAEKLDLMTGFSHPLEKEPFFATKEYVETQLQNPIQPYLEDSSLFIRTATFYFTGNERLDLPSSQRPRGPIHGVTQLQDHVRVIEGRLPLEGSQVLEVVLDSLGASALGVSAGDQLEIFPALQQENIERTLQVMVVGIIEPIDPTERYWQIGFPKRFTETGQWTTVPLYTNIPDLFDTLGVAFPGLNTDYFWFFFLDREGLRAEAADTLRELLPYVRANIFTNYTNASWQTDLEDVLDRYAFLLLLARIPLFLLVFLAIGMLLYYIFLIAGLLGRIRSPEVALFRSRGASMPQVGLVMLMEGGLMAVPAVIVGPFLAQALVLLAGTVFPSASGGTGLSFVDLSPSVFLLGSLGAVLAVAVLSITTLSASRHGIVELKRAGARPPQMPFIHRYYLDLVLLALIAMLWFQLRARGSFLVQTLSNEGVEMDFTLLLFPVLGVIGVGLVLFRLFPIVMKAIAWPVDSAAPIWLAQGLRRIARDPVPAASMLVLVALATALGVLSSTFTETLERSQKDRALYEVGTDYRIHYRISGRPAEKPEMAILITNVLSENELQGASDVTRPVGGVIAIDSENFADAAWYRPDFSDDPLAETLDVLKPSKPASQGIPLPAETTELGVWVMPGRLTTGFVLMARLQDADGYFFTSSLGVISDQGWHHLQEPIIPLYFGREGAIGEDLDFEPVAPFSLHSLWVVSIGESSETGALFFDELEAITPDGPVTLASFQSLEGWNALEDAESPGLYALEMSDTVARPGRQSAALTWGEGATQRGLRAGPEHLPIPAIASTSYLLENEVSIGDELIVIVGEVPVPVKIAKSVDFFPTMTDPRNRPFLVVDLHALIEYTSIRTPGAITSRWELWLQTTGTHGLDKALATIQSAGGTVTKIRNAEEKVGLLTADPLLTAGWSGLLALSFMIVVLASSSGLILYTYIDARERGEEFALLRTMGFSKPQVNGILWFNLALVVIVGALVGSWGGQLLGGTLLPLLEVAEEGSRVTPPMVLETNWAAMGLAYGILAIATAVTVSALAWAISHLDIQRVLRAGGA